MTHPSHLHSFHLPNYKVLHYANFPIIILLPPSQVQIFLLGPCSQTLLVYVRFEVLAVVNMKITVLTFGLCSFLNVTHYASYPQRTTESCPKLTSNQHHYS
jgi:hypothetical protein